MRNHQWNRAIPKQISRDAAEQKLSRAAVAIGTHHHIAGLQRINGGQENCLNRGFVCCKIMDIRLYSIS